MKEVNASHKHVHYFLLAVEVHKKGKSIQQITILHASLTIKNIQRVKPDLSGWGIIINEWSCKTYE